MSVSVNVTIPNLPANSGDLRYIVFDQEENELASGVTQANSDNLVVISWDGDGLDLLDAVAVHIDDFNGSNATSSKSCFGWTYAVNDDDDPVDEERWYWKANSEDKSVASLTESVTLSGDYSIELTTFLLSGGVSNSTLVGMEGISSLITVRSDGSINIRDDNGYLAQTDIGFFDFTIENKLRLERISGEAVFYINDVEIYRTTSLTGDFSVKLFGRYSSNIHNFADGYIYDVKLTGISDKSYTELSIPFDEPFTTQGADFYDSEGNAIGTKNRDVASDYTQSNPSNIDVSVFSLEFVDYTAIPDAAGVTSGYGFTCTGLFKMSNGNWLLGNHGKEDSGSVNNPSIIMLSNDFTQIISEIDVSDSTLAGNGSVQGVIEDSDGNLWFSAKDQDRVVCVSPSGVYLDEVAFTGPNGLAYDGLLNRLIIKSDSSSNCSIVDLETKSEVSTYSVISGGDHLCYVASQDYLYVTDGSNGVSGNVLIYDVSSGDAELINTLTAVNSEAIEGVGVVIDSDTRVYLCNDGGYHSEATIRDNAIMEYILIES